MRTLFIFTVLMGAKILSRLFYRHRIRWVDPVPEDRWGDLRLVILLNHTSLFEWLFAGSVPNRFLWRTARHGVIPVADKTLNRPLVGRFFKTVGQHVVSITRKPDESWKQLLDRVDPDSMVIILPEGRMKRADGLDNHGNPMTVRGGVADIMEGIPEGRMLIAYSGGLHHIQVPGERLPRLFKSIYLTIENLDIQDYRATLEEGIQEEGTQEGGIKVVMKDDLERRKALWVKTF